MKDTESLGAANVSTSCDTNDELLSVTDEYRDEEVVTNSLGRSSTSIWILDSSCPFHVCSNSMEFDT